MVPSDPAKGGEVGPEAHAGRGSRRGASSVGPEGASRRPVPGAAVLPGPDCRAPFRSHPGAVPDRQTAARDAVSPDQKSKSSMLPASKVVSSACVLITFRSSIVTVPRFGTSKLLPGAISMSPLRTPTAKCAASQPWL